MKCLGISLSLLCVAGAVHGADVTWGSMGTGTWDLADGANWEGGVVPELQFSGDYAAQALSPSARTVPPTAGAKFTLTASRDLVFRDFTFAHNDSQTNAKNWFDVDMDLGANRTLSFWGGHNASLWFNLYPAYQRVTLKSGTLKAYDAEVVPSQVSVGGVTYNFSQVFRMTTQKQGPVELIVDGPTSRMIFPQFTVGGANQRMCVINGGYVKGRLWVDGTPDRAGTNQVVLISGEGSIWDHDNGRSGNQQCYMFDPRMNTSETYPENGFLLHICDGGVMTNFAGSVGHRGSNAKILIDGGTLHTMKTGSIRDIVLGGNMNKSGSEVTSVPTNAVIEVTNGGKLYANVGQNANGAYVGGLIVGGWGNDCRLLVHDGGEVNTDVLFLGALSLSTNPYPDPEVHGRGNEVIVGPGGCLTVTNRLEIGQWSTYGGMDSRAKDCVLRVRGEGAKLYLPDSFNKTGASTASFSIKGQNCGLEVSDGGVVTNETSNVGLALYSTAWANVTRGGEIRMRRWFYIGYQGSSNAMCTVSDGGKITVGSETLNIGHQQQTAVLNGVPHEKYGNTLIVGDGGEVEALRLRMWGYGNRLVISNGLVTVKGERFISIYNGGANGSATEVLFEGNSPQMVAPGAQFLSEADVTMRVPKGGLTRSAIVANGYYGVTMDATCALNVEVEDDRDGYECVLMECTDPGVNAKITIDETVFAAAQERLPVYAKMYLTPNSKKLMLKMGFHNGTQIFVR